MKFDPFHIPAANLNRNTISFRIFWWTSGPIDLAPIQNIEYNSSSSSWSFLSSNTHLCFSRAFSTAVKGHSSPASRILLFHSQVKMFSAAAKKVSKANISAVRSYTSATYTEKSSFPITRAVVAAAVTAGAVMYSQESAEPAKKSSHVFTWQSEKDLKALRNGA